MNFAGRYRMKTREGKRVTRQQRTRRPVALSVFLLGVMLFVAACGGGNPTATTGSAAATTGATTAARATTGAATTGAAATVARGTATAATGATPASATGTATRAGGTGTATRVAYPSVPSQTTQPANASELRNLRGEIIIDGSSTVFPVTAAASEEFNKYAPNVRIPVGVSGTGGGFQKFCAG